MSLSLEKIVVHPGESVLVYGIGNVGRQDDGLGVRLVERLERDFEDAARTKFESNYQLGIEDALLVSSFDVVLFLDASCERTSGDAFTVQVLAASDQIGFTTHAMSFSSVLSIGEELYRRAPRAFLIAIQGYEWGICEELSELAALNLEEAYAALSALLASGRKLQGAAARGDGSRRLHA